MSSVSPSQLPGIVTDAGYEVMINNYNAEPAVRQQIFEIVPMTGSEFGFTGKALVGDNIPKEIGISEEAPAVTMDEGYQWFARQRKIAIRVDLPEELMQSPNASAMIMAKIRDAASGFGAGFQVKKEQIAADIFNKGALTAGDRDAFSGTYEGHVDPYPKFIFDGKPFFAASGNNHPSVLNSSLTYYNKVATTLSSTNLAAARQLMEDTNAYDEAGNRISIRGDILVVPPALEDTARVILNSELLPGTAQNDTNYLRGAYTPVKWRYLTTATSWAIGQARKGLKFFDSGLPQIEISGKDPKTGDYVVRFYGYCAVAVTDWRFWVASNFPAS